MFRLGRAAVICALCLSLGGQWLALQSVAWTTMLVKNAQRLSLTEAMVKTFDGAHPCDLCHAVAAGKKSEQKSSTLPTVAKVDLICPARQAPLPARAVPYIYPSVVFETDTRSSAPPVPPPRALLA